MQGSKTSAKAFLTWSKLWRSMENSTFHLYRKLCQIKNRLILSEEKKFSIEIPSKKEHTFLREICRACFIKVIE